MVHERSSVFVFGPDAHVVQSILLGVGAVLWIGLTYEKYAFSDEHVTERTEHTYRAQMTLGTQPPAVEAVKARVVFCTVFNTAFDALWLSGPFVSRLEAGKLNADGRAPERPAVSRRHPSSPVPDSHSNRRSGNRRCMDVVQREMSEEP